MSHVRQHRALTSMEETKKNKIDSRNQAGAEHTERIPESESRHTIGGNEVVVFYRCSAPTNGKLERQPKRKNEKKKKR